ncbi:hypothetical protein ILUMI_24528 [Ignelater luminosus]|uniref:Uncharacterized protein n=1 Tax=Ignelater luminosus TaxID=2038154 RepID=A0A8K0G0K7_IGNLU|nr:hypothetical protein ILUMI_24528 [Ignelater luminosus]
MGVISVFGGVLGLRLPETLHHRLPQTLEDGELFGKEFTMKDCCRCIPLKNESSVAGSYEDLELEPVKEEISEQLPLENIRRISMKRLARQASFMDTQKDYDGSIRMTYWV